MVDGRARVRADGVATTTGATPVAVEAARLSFPAIQVAKVLLVALVAVQERPVADVRARIPALTGGPTRLHGLALGLAVLTLTRRVAFVARGPNAGAETGATARRVATTRPGLVASGPPAVAPQTPRRFPMRLLVAGRLVGRRDRGPSFSFLRT